MIRSLASAIACLVILTSACASNVVTSDSTEEHAWSDDAKADGPGTSTLSRLQGITTQSIFRQPVHPIGSYGDWSYLKIKGDLAEAISNAMTDAAEECDGNKCARMGEHILCVPPNTFEPTVCEIRFTRTRNGNVGAMTSPRPDFNVYHSAELNRFYGTSFVQNGLLVFKGDSANALENALVNGKPRNSANTTPSDEVRFKIVDLAAGVLSAPTF